MTTIYYIKRKDTGLTCAYYDKEEWLKDVGRYYIADYPFDAYSVTYKHKSH